MKYLYLEIFACFLFNFYRLALYIIIKCVNMIAATQMCFGPQLYAPPYFENFITLNRFRKYGQAKRKKNHSLSHLKEKPIDHLDCFCSSRLLFIVVLFLVFEYKETWCALPNKYFHRAKNKTLERMIK